jgi:glutamate-5-semialdehyde dehydrogenase
MEISKQTEDVKKDSFKMASLSLATRNAALVGISEALKAGASTLFAANNRDFEDAEKSGVAGPLLKRLRFDQHKLDEVISGIDSLIGLPDPLFNVLLTRQLDTGLVLNKVTCPIGVIGVIFESRPDALVQIATLCLKSGNCCILKGGSEAANTNRALFEIISRAAILSGVPQGFITLLETRSDIDELLKCDRSIDLLIPRGGNAFVQYIMAHSRIPVMGHADGICHVYVDETADLAMASTIIVDSKVQYVAACNTLETLLVHHKAAADLLPVLKTRLDEAHVRIKGCPRTLALIACTPALPEDFDTEHLDYILSIKIVDGLSEAITHINTHGSHHTDSIISKDPRAVELFMLLVDSAGVYHNCSTRFADGYRYGFGAEVGISTGKLHARGPVGLDGLVTYKYKLFGEGQIVADYASGLKSFHFKDL